MDHTDAIPNLEDQAPCFSCILLFFLFDTIWTEEWPRLSKKKKKEKIASWSEEKRPDCKNHTRKEVSSRFSIADTDCLKVISDAREKIENIWFFQCLVFQTGEASENHHHLQQISKCWKTTSKTYGLCGRKRRNVRIPLAHGKRTHQVKEAMKNPAATAPVGKRAKPEAEVARRGKMTEGSVHFTALVVLSHCDHAEVSSHLQKVHRKSRSFSGTTTLRTTTGARQYPQSKARLAAARFLDTVSRLSI